MLRSLGCLLVVVVVVVSVVLTISTLLLPQVPLIPPKRGYMGYAPRPLIAAHRGSRYLNPENTLLAHQMAKELGADILEMDIRLSKDGYLVVIHDEDPYRTCGEHGVVENMTLSELKALDAGFMFTPDNGKTYPLRAAGLTIPTFREFLEHNREHWINIEFKEDDPRVADSLLEHFKMFPETPWENQVVFGSRWCGVLNYFRDKSNGLFATSACEAEATLFYILARLHLAVPYLRIFPPKAMAFQLPLTSGPSMRADLPELLHIAHAFGVQVHYWVINDMDTMRRLIDLGADAIITDRTDLAAKIFFEERNFTRYFPPPKGERTPYSTPSASKPEVHTCVTPICIVM